MKNKTFIGYITRNDYDFNDKNQSFGLPSTYIIKDFNVQDIRNIKINIACLGVYSIYVNGALVNNEFMSQDCSEYCSTITYRTYNISKYLVRGSNRLGLVLSDGWYASNLSIVHKNVFGEYPLKVNFEIKENSIIIAKSDGSELAGIGPIQACDNQNGIIIDANINMNDFQNNVVPKTIVHKVSVYKIDVKIVKSILPPVKIIKHFKPKLIRQNGNELIYDCGQNFAGVVHSVFVGNKNDRVTIYHAEILDENGDIYTKNLRTALAKDEYILSGKKDEFLPLHTFHGFRYFKVVLQGNITILNIEALPIMTKIHRTGNIKTNNKLVNKIYNNILWGQRSNYISIPTDCPQRDERMGWTGDAQVFAETACFNYDCSKFLKNYVNCLMDSMDEYIDSVPVFVPYFHRKDPALFAGAQGWSDAIIIIPYTLYLYYGDITTLRRAYPYMKRFLNYVRKNNIKNGLYEGFSFGDWLSVFEITDTHFYDNCYYTYDNYLMKLISTVLNKNECVFYNKEYERARETTRKHFITENGIIANDTQGSYVLAYKCGVATLDEVKNHIVRKIEEFGHLTTGFHSTKSLLPLLCEINRSDLAYNILINKKYPSWGYEISCGATTIWERWDSFRKDEGFNKDGMNSFNHYSLGAVGEWMYKTMLGISPVFEKPGFKACNISPCFDNRVTKLKGTFTTKKGKIFVEYIIDNKIIKYTIKSDTKIELLFNFNNKIIDSKKISENHYEFVLSL